MVSVFLGQILTVHKYVQIPLTFSSLLAISQKCCTIMKLAQRFTLTLSSLFKFVPGVPAFAAPGPAPNVYPVAVVNAVSLVINANVIVRHVLEHQTKTFLFLSYYQPPFMGLPQMAQMNPPQQPFMVNFKFYVGLYYMKKQKK